MKRLSLACVALSVCFLGASSVFGADIVRWEPVNDGSAMPTTADSSFKTNSAWVGYSNGGVYFTSNPDSDSPSWTRMDKGSNMGQPFDMGFSKNITAIGVADTNDEYVAYVAMHSEKYYSQLYRCTYGRGQVSWTNLSGAGLTDIEGVSVNPLARERVYVTSANGVMYSRDSGYSWQSSSAGEVLVPPTGSAVSAFAATNLSRAVDWIVVGTANGELWKVVNARSGAGQWVRLNPYGSTPLPQRTVTRVQLDGSANTPAILAVYGGTNSKSVWLSYDGGYSFNSSPNPTRGYAPSVLSVSLSPMAGDATFYGQVLGFGAVRSLNNGQTWTFFSR